VKSTNESRAHYAPGPARTGSPALAQTTDRSTQLSPARRGCCWYCQSTCFCSNGRSIHGDAASPVNDAMTSFQKINCTPLWPVDSIHAVETCFYSATGCRRL